LKAAPRGGEFTQEIKELKQGGFGLVWSGITNTRVPIAIKILKPSSNSSRDLDTWFNEQDILRKCPNHPHIVQCYDSFHCENDGSLVIIMEKAEGSLEDFLKLNPSVNPLDVCSIGIQICSALEHIHNNLGVIHRDLTLRNILYFSDGHFKISDFGISKQTVSQKEYATTLIGFPYAIPPELLLRFPYSPYSTYRSDIYQLGIILLTLLRGSEPIPNNLSREQTNQMIQDGLPRQIAESLISRFGMLAEIISKMLRRHDSWRYQNVLEVKYALQTAFDQHQVLRVNQNWLQYIQ
jgi:eukaryotic-like serine/threonine-protein kinase